MKNLIEYKDYVGSVEFSADDGLFFGKVQAIRALISYEGTNATELIEDFHSAVDEYLEICQEEGKKPEKAYKGSFNIRVTPALHKKIAIYAMEHGIALNSFVEQSVEKQLACAY